MDTNLFIAKDVNPDQFAKAKTIADEMGLSPQFVNNSLPEFEKKQNELKVQNDLNALTYSAPVTKEFVSNPDNLILSQDSLKELSEIEKTISKRTENQYYNTFVSNIYGMAANVAQLPGVLGYIQRENQKFANKVSKDINIGPTELVPDVQITVSEQDAKEQFQYFKNNSFVNNLRENQNYFAAKAPDAQMSVIEEAKNGNFLNAGRALSLQVVGNAPNLIANIAAYWAGGPVLGSATAFVPTFSQGATEAIEKGKPEAALTSGAVQGAAEVLFENLGSFRLLKNTEQQLVKTIGKEGAKEVIYNSAKQLVNNSFQEGTEEFATSIAQDLTKYVVEDDKDALKGIMTRAFDSFLVGAGSGVGISAAGNVSGLIRYNQKIKQAESDAELYSALAGKTKLSERSTEAQKQFIAKQTEGGPIENTYISREGFKEYAQKQNKSETEIAQEMGILEEFNKSVETETDIEVSTSKMATDVAKSIHHAELKNDIKFNPENLTVNEAKKAQDETKTQVQEQFDTAMAAMPEESQIKYKESAKEVYKLIAQDLRNTDKMSAQELSANSQIWENTFLTYGVLTNTDPLELFKKYGVNIRAIDQSVEMKSVPTLNQKQNEFFQQFKKDNLGFYSKLISTVEQKMSATQDANSLKSMLKEIKADEAKWLGLDAFLKGKTKVNKQELLDYLKANELGIEEVQISSKNYTDAEYELFNNWNKRKLNQGFKNPETNKFERFDVDYYDLNIEIKDDNLSAKIKLNPFTNKYELSANATNYSLGGVYDSFETASIELMMNYINSSKKSTNTKYSDYKTPNGENYREVLFTLPAKDEGARRDELSMLQRERKLTESEQAEYADLRNRNVGYSVNKYESSHWDQSNVLAHTRLQDFTDTDGNKVLLIEEIQSDWHQEGRKKGYKTEQVEKAKELKQLTFNDVDVFDDGYSFTVKLKDENLKLFQSQTQDITVGKGVVGDQEQAAKLYALQMYNKEIVKKNEIAADDFRNKSSMQVPDAPFAKNWHEFVFKRILTMAVEQGYDKVAWTYGEQQAERFDLSKEISKIELTDLSNADGEGLELTAYDLNDNAVISQKVKDESEAADYIGKEAAQKLFSKDYVENDFGMNVKTIKDVDLKVGGEGMKGFYDKILVDYAKKLGKKFDSEVKDISLITGKEEKTYTQQYQEKILSAIGDYKFEDFKKVKKDSDEYRTVYKVKGTSLTYTVFNEGPRAGKVNFYSDETGSKGFRDLNDFKDIFNKIESKDIVTEFHSMEITDKLKQQVVGQGFELFQDKKASFQILGNKQFNINLFETSDESSFMHESAHYFLEVMKDLATEQNARPEMVELFNDVLKTLNVESADQIGEKEQEIFARSFEAYLMKGEAPSKGLRKAFAQFKTFLINIYKNLTGLEKQAEPYGINVSDQMKSVFDRMLVAGEEILDAEKNGPQPLFTDAVLSGLNAEKAQKYIDAMEQARAFAEDELRAKLMKDVIKKKDKAFNEKYNELVQKGTDLANSLTEFKAMQTIRENEQLKISKPYVEKYFPELAKYIPNDLMVQDGGVNPDVIAEMLGYPTGYAMLEAIKPYRKGIEAFAETYAATKIKEQFPELLEQPELSDEAIKAAHNENYRLVKRLELEFLQEQFPQIVKDTAGRLIRRMPKTQAVIQQADNIIAQTNVSQIKPHLFLNAEKKHAAEAAKQFKKGEFELAFEAKRKEYLNFELYRSAIKAKEDVNKSVKSFKDLFKSDEDMAKRYDMDLINAGRAILAMYGIGKPGKLPSDYIEKIKQYDPEAYVTIEALVKSAMDGAGEYESVSYDKFVEMRDTVDALKDLARTSKEAEIDGNKIEMEKVVDDLTGRIAELTPADAREYYKTASEWEKHKDQLMGAVATLKRVESWALGLGGNFHKYIYQPIADATTAYRLRKIEVLKQYRNLLETYIQNQPGFEEPIVATELKFKDKTFVFKNKSELIALLLHTGNESNKSKLLEGYGWGERNQQGQLVSPEWDSFIDRMINEGKLTKNDFDFVQGVWDLFESLKPEIQKAHKKMLGFYMNEITANEFTNQFGTYRGGYAPAKTDYAEVYDTKTKEMLEQINSDASLVFPTTGRGATRSRVESYKAPLSRDINMIGSHIDWAMRYAFIEPAVKQTARMLINKKFMTAFNEFDKAAIENMLKPWLDRTAKQQVISPSKDGMWRYMDTIASFLRRNVNMQIMTFNVVNSLEQFGGLAVATSKVKPKYIKSALVNYMSNGPAMVDDIMTKSDFIRSIAGENIHDIHNGIREILVAPTAKDKIQDFARKNVYVLQSATQNIVNTIVWSGAYAEAKDNGMSENEAVKLADSVVRTTQGTNLPEDISKFETGTQTELLFKTYVSYFNMLTNLTASRINEIHRSVGLRKGAGELFYLYAAVLAVPSAISMALRMGAAGIVDEDDDDFYVDDILANFFGYQLKTVAAGVPFAGQFAVAGINRVMTKNQLDDRLSLSPAISIAETMAGVPGAVAEQIIERGELSKKTVKDALTFMGVVSSLPIGVLGKPVGYIMDVESGKARPTGPIDFTRGLVTGKTGSQ